MGVLTRHVRNALPALNSGQSVVEPSRSGGTQPAAGFNFGGGAQGFINRVGGIGGLMALGNPVVQTSDGFINNGGGQQGGASGQQQGGVAPSFGIQDLESLLNVARAAMPTTGDGGNALASALGNSKLGAAPEADPYAQSNQLASQLLSLQDGAGGAQQAQQGLGDPQPQAVKVEDQTPQNAFEGSEGALNLAGLIDFISRIAGGR